MRRCIDKRKPKNYLQHAGKSNSTYDGPRWTRDGFVPGRLGERELARAKRRIRAR